jgi:hypothetical protein
MINGTASEIDKRIEALREELRQTMMEADRTKQRLHAYQTRHTLQVARAGRIGDEIDRLNVALAIARRG